jgi:transposase
MEPAQVSPVQARFGLRTERIGPLPLLNHFIERLGLAALLERHVPTDRRHTVSHAQALLVLLRSILIEREPIYRQQETVHGFAASLFGLDSDQAVQIGDDRLGRALDALFFADRAALLTELVVTVGKMFAVDFAELHNDSTSIRFCGQYRSASRASHGRTAPAIVYGYSKDHRPDLKQLIFILTSSADGGVPVQFRTADGNTSDSITHIETWETLKRIAGRADFLYVADSKLCSYDNLDHIHRSGGRFVTVLPRTRFEDRQFRRAIQTETIAWEKIWDRPHPRNRRGPRDRWYTYRHPLPSAEVWPVTWVWSTLLTLKQHARRQQRLAAAVERLSALKARLARPRARRRAAAQLDLLVAHILERLRVTRYLKVERVVREVHTFKQIRRGRPGPDTQYKKLTRKRYDLEWSLDQAAILYDEKSDGMYPLLCNDRSLSPEAVLTAHKGQPTLEKRFEQTKTVHEIAPVFLKSPARVEALFTLYFTVLLVQALIERELRRAMRREHIDSLPLYPEARPCKHPTTEQILRHFLLAERHTLTRDTRVIQIFHPELSTLQRQIITLLGVDYRAFCV